MLVALTKVPPPFLMVPDGVDADGVTRWRVEEAGEPAAASAVQPSPSLQHGEEVSAADSMPKAARNTLRCQRSGQPSDESVKKCIEWLEGKCRSKETAGVKYWALRDQIREAENRDANRKIRGYNRNILNAAKNALLRRRSDLLFLLTGAKAPAPRA